MSNVLCVVLSISVLFVTCMKRFILVSSIQPVSICASVTTPSMKMWHHLRSEIKVVVVETFIKYLFHILYLFHIYNMINKYCKKKRWQLLRNIERKNTIQCDACLKEHLVYNQYNTDMATPGVNFINILQASFIPIFLHQKITKPKCNSRKAAQSTFVQKIHT
jgi:hypothetical protein